MSTGKAEKLLQKSVLPLLLLTLLSCGGGQEFSTTYSQPYARAITLMMSEDWDQLALSGKGIKIGVIDAGFKGTTEDPALRNCSIQSTMNFTLPGGPSAINMQEGATHGTEVLRNIAGKSQTETWGLAPAAAYYLALTEIMDSETIREEKLMIEAIRWMVEQDVRIINISLNYRKFDDADAYTPQDLDGKTALSTRFIDSLCSNNPRVTIVVSAGNEGNKSWKYPGFPADARQAITVGGTQFDGIRPHANTPYCPEGLPYVKPDVATYEYPRGNSYTAPIITGLIAQMLEYDPSLKNAEIAGILHRAGHLRDEPDLRLGYGVPSTQLILEQLQGRK